MQRGVSGMAGCVAACLPRCTQPLAELQSESAEIALCHSHSHLPLSCARSVRASTNLAPALTVSSAGLDELLLCPGCLSELSAPARRSQPERPAQQATGSVPAASTTLPCTCHSTRHAFPHLSRMQCQPGSDACRCACRSTASCGAASSQRSRQSARRTWRRAWTSSWPTCSARWSPRTATSSHRCCLAANAIRRILGDLHASHSRACQLVAISWCCFAAGKTLLCCMTD